MTQNRLYQPTLCVLCMDLYTQEWTDAEQMSRELARQHNLTKEHEINQLRIRIYRISKRLYDDGFLERKRVDIPNTNLMKIQFRRK